MRGRGGGQGVRALGKCVLTSYYNCPRNTSDLNCYKYRQFPESSRCTHIYRAQQSDRKGGQTLSSTLYAHHLNQSSQKPRHVHIIPITDKELRPRECQ